MISKGLKKRGVIYIPFLMVLILIFSLVVNSNYTSRNVSTYLIYESFSEIEKVEFVNEFIYKLQAYKDNYYYDVDNELIEDSGSFLNYIKNNNVKLFNGNLYILDFITDSGVKPSSDKILFYYSDKSKEGYYFYARENGRNIDLNIARIFRI